MRLVVDINLSPDWVNHFSQHGYRAVHWSAIGDPRAPDSEILEWARAHHHVVFTHDLDFSRILALSGAEGPSVFQVRSEDILPAAIGDLVVNALRQHAETLEAGAVAVLDTATLRVRLLPM